MQDLGAYIDIYTNTHIHISGKYEKTKVYVYLFSFLTLISEIDKTSLNNNQSYIQEIL